MSKPKVGIFGFTGCGGCQLEILNFEDQLLDLVGAVDIVHFTEAITEFSDTYEIALIEGSITTEHGVERIKKITSFYTAVGFAGAKQELYYVAVDEADQVHEGGGIDVEAIEVVYLPISKAKTFIYDEKMVKTPGIMFAMSWWLARV